MWFVKLANSYHSIFFQTMDAPFFEEKVDVPSFEKQDDPYELDNFVIKSWQYIIVSYKSNSDTGMYNDN